MSERKINLLPKSRQTQLVFRAWYVSLLRVYIVAGLSLLLMSVALFGVGSYIQISRSGLDKEAEELRRVAASSEVGEIRNQVKDVNQWVKDYNTLAAGLPRWSKFMQRFSQVVPPGVEIRSLSVDAVGLKVEVRGFAPTRELVIAFHDRLVEASDSFAKVDYPLENVSRAEDIPFHYTFTINPELLK